MREETFLAARSRQRLHSEQTSTPGREGGRAPGLSGRASGLSGEAFRASGLVTEPPLAQLEDATVLPPAALETLLCDAEVQRLVLDPAGQPLDVGVATRSFTRDLRVAITRRDRHCQYPGCALRASWCELHHIRYWKHGGATSLDNGITLCAFHHHHVHTQSLSIRAVAGGFVFTDQNGHQLGSTTRLHDTLLVPRTWPTGPTGPTGPAGTGPPGPSDDASRDRSAPEHGERSVPGHGEESAPRHGEESARGAPSPGQATARAPSGELDPGHDALTPDTLFP